MNTTYRTVLCVALALVAAGVSFASSPAVPVETVRAGETAGQIVVPVDKSRLLRFDRAFREISVGNREVAEVQPLSHQLIYVLGKKIGTTNLTIMGPGGTVIAVVDVVVSYDIDGIKRRLHELMPQEKIDVAASGDALSLSGRVSSPGNLRQILEVAEHYAPGKVSNLLSLSGSQQVLLQVKFAEVQRTAMRNLDANGGLQWTAGADSISSGWGPVFPDPVTGLLDASKAFGAVTSTLQHGNFTIKAGIEALEKKGLVRTLAEPNLVALSGDTASFLAGGEFPIPVAQTSSGTGVPVVTIDYKQFGVSLAFTPTVVGADTVNLVLKSEVSALDNANAITANGFDIPALKVRRAKTTVELRDGQSFAIAGLLQDDFANNTGQLPFLGSVPVLGALFRSWEYNHQQTDLVLIVTVHLVSPTVAGNLNTPLDAVVLPSPIEQATTGAVEKDGKPAAPAGDNSGGYVLP
jgi:pilus assembly protein CpaC